MYSPIPGLPLLSVNIFLLPLPSQSLVEDLGACAKGSGGAGEKLISPKNVLTHTQIELRLSSIFYSLKSVWVPVFWWLFLFFYKRQTFRGED